MFIENRIKKRNETDSCKRVKLKKFDFEKNLLFIIKRQVFPYKRSGNNFVTVDRDIYSGQTTVNYKPNTNGLLIYNPNTIICEAQAKKLENSKIVENKAVQAKKSVR